MCLQAYMAVHTWAVAVVIATLACTPTRISSNIIHALIAHSDNSSDNSFVDVENQRPGKDERGRHSVDHSSMDTEDAFGDRSLKQSSGKKRAF